MPLKASRAVRRCPRAINDALLKSQRSKCNIKNMPQWISEGRGGKTYVPSFRTILFKETLENIRYTKTNFQLSDIHPYIINDLTSLSCSLILFRPYLIHQISIPSKPKRWEVLSTSVRAKVWFCCVDHLHILEVCLPHATFVPVIYYSCMTRKN